MFVFSVQASHAESVPESPLCELTHPSMDISEELAAGVNISCKDMTISLLSSVLRAKLPNHMQDNSELRDPSATPRRHLRPFREWA